MLYAVKGNTQLKIDEAEKAEYLKQGYDIAQEVDGGLNTLEASPAKTVSYKEYEALLRENVELKNQLGATGSDEELKALQDKLSEAQKEIKALKDAAKKAE